MNKLDCLDIINYQEGMAEIRWITGERYDPKTGTFVRGPKKVTGHDPGYTVRRQFGETDLEFANRIAEKKQNNHARNYRPMNPRSESRMEEVYNATAASRTEKLRELLKNIWWDQQNDIAHIASVLRTAHAFCHDAENGLTRGFHRSQSRRDYPAFKKAIQDDLFDILKLGRLGHLQGQEDEINREAINTYQHANGLLVLTLYKAAQADHGTAIRLVDAFEYRRDNEKPDLDVSSLPSPKYRGWGGIPFKPLTMGRSEDVLTHIINADSQFLAGACAGVIEYIELAYKGEKDHWGRETASPLISDFTDSSDQAMQVRKQIGRYRALILQALEKERPQSELLQKTLETIDAKLGEYQLAGVAQKRASELEEERRRLQQEFKARMEGVDKEIGAIKDMVKRAEEQMGFDHEG